MRSIMTFFGGSARETGTALGRPRTFLNVVLDESSSMLGVADATLQAFNHFIERQREESVTAKDEVFVTLTMFSDAHRVRTVYANKPLATVPVLTRSTYHPSGMTALYDGIARSIVSMEQQVGTQARVLMLVITDGEENASREIRDIAVIKQMVSERQERGNWTFVFLSAGDDPFAAAASMGFKVGNVSPYTTHAIDQALVRVGQAVASYRQGDAMQTGTFYAGEAPKWKKPEWTRTGTDEQVEDVV